MKNPAKKINDLTIKQFNAALTRNGISLEGSTYISSRGYRFQLEAELGVAGGTSRRSKLSRAITLAEELDEQVAEIAVEVAVVPQPAIALVEALPELEGADAGQISDEALTKGSKRWAEIEATGLLGDTAIVWENEAGRIRVGIPTTGTGRSVEDGKLMIGAGASYTEAVRDAKKRYANFAQKAA